MAERSSATSGAAARESGVPTFSFQVGNPTSAARAVSQNAPVRGGVRAAAAQVGLSLDHAGVARAGAQADAVAQRDYDMLMKFAGPVLAKAQQKAEQGAYWEGVKRAATGESMKEIVDEQPWYSQIFGESPVVEGARAYTAQAKLDQTQAALQERMFELRKQSPDQVVQVYTGALDAMMTGDPMTDAVLQQSAAQQLPLLLKQHAKEHYAYLQTNLKNTQFESWTPAAKVLQSAGQGYAAGTIDDKAWEIQKTQFLGKVVPLDGQTDESYKKNILAMYGKAAQDGNFHAVSLMDEAGVRQFLSPEQLRTVDDQVFRYSQRAKADYASQHMATDIAALQVAVRTGQISPADAADTARMMNQKFRRATGIPEDVIDVEKVTTTAGVQMFEDANRGRNAQQLKEAKLTNAAIAFSAGYGASSYADTGLSKTEADGAFRQAYGKAENKVEFLVKNAVTALDPYVSPAIAGAIRGTVQGSLGQQWNKGMEDRLGEWRQLKAAPNGGDAAAAAYYGNYHAQFAALDTLVNRGIPVEQAYDRVFNHPVPPAAELTKANRAALEGAIKAANQYDGLKSYFSWFVGHPLSDSGVRGLTAVVGPKFDQFMQLNPDADPEATAKSLTQAMIANGEVEMYGEYAWSRNPSQVPLTQYVGPVKEWASEAVEASISAKLKASGANSVDSYTIWRGPDGPRGPVMQVQANTDQGWVGVTIYGDEIKSLYDKHTKGRTLGTSMKPAIGNRDWSNPVGIPQ